MYIYVYACTQYIILAVEWIKKNVALQHFMENEMQKWAQKSAQSSEQVAVTEARHTHKNYKADERKKH